MDNTSVTAASLLKEKQLKVVVQRQTTLALLEKSGLSVGEYAKNNGLSEATIRRHLRLAKQGVMALADGRKGRSGRKLKPIDDRLFQFVLAFLEQHKKAKKRALFKILEDKCTTEGWIRITYRTLVRLIRSLPDDLTTLLEMGRKFQFETRALVARRTVLVPNEEWQVDISELPVWILDITTMTLFKPQIITFIDCATRVVMGWRVFRHDPTTSDLILTLRMAIMAKNDDSYPFMGLPKGIQSDNGSVFESADYLDCLVRLGATQLEIPNDAPAANGKIERFFRTIQDQLISSLNGFSDQHEGLKAARKAPIPWPILPRLIASYLARYHTQVHSALGKSPWEAWHENLGVARGLLFNPHDITTATMVRLEVPVHHEGVHLPDKNTYSGACLTALVDKTITVRVAPMEPYDRVEAYYEGKPLGLLTNVHDNPELAAQIKEYRLNRSIELQSLSKVLKSMSTVLPNPTMAPPACVGDAESVSAPESPKEAPLGQLPKLTVEEEEA